MSWQALAAVASTQLLSEFVDSLTADTASMELWMRGRADLGALSDVEIAGLA